MERTLLGHFGIENKKYSIATLAIVYNSETGAMKLGVSACSKKEQYNRKIGNKIAIGRANIRPCYTSFIGAGVEVKRLIEYVHEKSIFDIENYIKLQTASKRLE